MVFKYIGEFGYEITLAIPHAYWLYRNNKLSETVSLKGMKPFYYFSPKHTEIDGIRDDKNNYIGLPKNLQKYISSRELYSSNWIKPDYKEQYKNDRFKFNKPLLIVANKKNYNVSTTELQHLSIDLMRWIYETYRDKYHIIYNRMKDEIGYVDYGDYDLCNEYGIHTMYDYVEDDYNTTQLMIYSNCENYISVQGGQAYLCSMFGGKNTVYAEIGREVTHNDFRKNFHKYSGAKIYHGKTYEQMKKIISEVY